MYQIRAAARSLASRRHSLTTIDPSMKCVSLIQPRDWRCTPLEVAAAWPADRPLLMLHSGRAHPRWARWSILAPPTCTYRFDGRSRWIGSPHERLAEVRFSDDPLADVDAILAATSIRATASNEIPFQGGWIGYFSYDLGRIIEPAAQRTDSPPSENAAWPLIELAYCPDALVYDNLNRAWHSVGNVDHLELDVAAAQRDAESERFELGPLVPHIGADKYVSMVARTIEYIAAGDVFQANIAQRFSAEFAGSTRALAVAAFMQSQPWYGAYLELAEEDGRGQRAEGRGQSVPSVHTSRCILSLSPELFLQFDPRTRDVITRPIKGTRPATGSAQELLDSEKDAAELHMIVDLMRNDLGRVCEYGSVRVPNPRMIESHPTVHHGVGEVVGRMRPGVSFGELLRATFPPGSVTGAPKIRAMQIIDELEADQRGPYCGAIGYISNCGAAKLNVAIRTLLLSGHAQPGRTDRLAGEVAGVRGTRGRGGVGSADYGAGAGIVADSIPEAEHRETLDKAAVVRKLCRSPAPAEPAAARPF